MERYNKLLLREVKGEVFLNDESIPLDTRLKQIPEYNKIVNEIESILIQLRQKGYKPTSDEIFGGFQEAEIVSDNEIKIA